MSMLSIPVSRPFPQRPDPTQPALPTHGSVHSHEDPVHSQTHIVMVKHPVILLHFHGDPRRCVIAASLCKHGNTEAHVPSPDRPGDRTWPGDRCPAPLTSGFHSEAGPTECVEDLGHQPVLHCAGAGHLQSVWSVITRQPLPGRSARCVTPRGPLRTWR